MDWIAEGEKRFKQLREIRDGFTNLVKDGLGQLDPEEAALYEARYAFCSDCPMRKGNVCSTSVSIPHVETGEYVDGCGCMLAAAVKSPTHECPAGKWKSIQHLVDAIRNK